MALSDSTSTGARSAVGPDGEIYVAWEDFATEEMLARKSMDFGASFEPTFLIGSVRDNLGTTPPGWRNNDERRNPVYVGGRQFGPNFPSIAVDRTSGPRRGQVYVAWSEYAAGSTEAPTRLVAEQEPNGFFVNATEVQIGDEIRGQGESGDEFEDPPGDFFDMFALEVEQGTTIRIEGSIEYVNPPSPYPIYFSNLLLCAQDTLRPLEIARTSIAESWLGLMPPLLFTIPESGRYFLRMGGVGGHRTGYRLRLTRWNVHPDQAARDHRDIVCVTSLDGGQTWSAKRLVNDSPPNFDDTIPTIAVDHQGVVHVLWYGRAGDPICGALAHTYWARSRDGGQIFLPSLPISTQPGRWDSLETMVDSNIGDRMALVAHRSRVCALWTQAGAPELDIYGRKIEADDVTGALIGWFRAERIQSGVQLRWYVSKPGAGLAFRVHRQDAADLFIPLTTELQPANDQPEQEFVDRTAQPEREYSYKLEVVTPEGATLWEGPILVGDFAERGKLALRLLSSNPFTDTVRLRADLPKSGRIRVRVLNLMGRHVATVFDGSAAAGPLHLNWGGLDQDGQNVAPGLYVIDASLGLEHVSTRILRLP